MEEDLRIQLIVATSMSSQIIYIKVLPLDQHFTLKTKFYINNQLTFSTKNYKITVLKIQLFIFVWNLV